MADSNQTIRTALVTGAGQGIGRAIAQLLAANQFRVILVGRTKAKLVNVAQAIKGLGPEPQIVPLDVTSSEHIWHLQQNLERENHPLDLLVNCAGAAFIAPIEETTEADWDRLLAVNLKGPFLMTKAVLPLLRKSENASIVNIVSKVALKGYGTVTAYTAAKAGLLGFTQSLANELREDEIRVVALCPGPVDTPMRWDATPEYDRKLVIDAEFVATTVLHLIQLPRGVTMGPVLIESVHYD